MSGRLCCGSARPAKRSRGGGQVLNDQRTLEAIMPAVYTIRGHTRLVPRAAIITGSGLGPLADEVERPICLAYADIPGFPRATIAGHSGQLILGYLGQQPLA